jgi:hypothetical protein
MEIDKFLLHVDHDYQRDNINEERVNKISKSWSWPACGCISVARRPDGTYWVFDGQHRALAARKREDIQDLPCLVFHMREQREEAKGFVEANTVRGPMRSYERFKGRLVAQEANALRVAAALDDIGYRVGTGQKNELACIDAVEGAFNRDPESAAVALQVCADLYDGERIPDKVYKGLFCLENHLKSKGGGSISRHDIYGKLKSITPTELLAEVRKSVAYHGKSGEKVYADGIAKFVNKKKTKNRIPSPIA